MQSLQDVALQRPIMTVEQFIEKVAWPGAQPSLVREGRDPTAQVPLQVEDASSEATILEPSVYEAEEAGRTQMRQEVATLEKTPHVTANPPSPVVDQSYPQQAADLSTPVLEMPEDPTTPVLRLTTTPPVTHVLQFTDEEDTQDQDSHKSFKFLFLFFDKYYNYYVVSTFLFVILVYAYDYILLLWIISMNVLKHTKQFDLIL